MRKYLGQGGEKTLKQMFCEHFNIENFDSTGWQDLKLEDCENVSSLLQEYFDTMEEHLYGNEEDDFFFSWVAHLHPHGASACLPNAWDMWGTSLAYEIEAPDAGYYHILLDLAEHLSLLSRDYYERDDTDRAWLFIQVANDCIINSWNNTSVTRIIQAAINNGRANH